MNIDELKALVEAVKAVSGDARAVLLWYFGDYDRLASDNRKIHQWVDKAIAREGRP